MWGICDGSRSRYSAMYRAADFAKPMLATSTPMPRIEMA